MAKLASRRSMKTLGLLPMMLSLCPACGQGEASLAVAEQKQAITQASPGDVVLRIQAATRQLQEATRNLNEVLAGAYSSWPSKAQFAGSYSIRGFRNDLEALNASAFVAAAYAAGAYSSPSLDFMDRQQLGGAYAINPGSAGAYVIGAHFGGAYVLPSGGIGGAYVAGAYSDGVMDKIIRLNRE